MWWKSLKNILINFQNYGNMKTNGNLFLSSSSSGLVITVKFLIYLQVTASIILPTATEYSTAHLQPYFDFDVQRNVTFTFGQTGFLHCKVERIGDKDKSKIINGVNMNYLVLGDPAYPLLDWLLNGYTGNIDPLQESFNAYINSARIIIELTIGKLKSRWRILKKINEMDYKFISKVSWIRKRDLHILTAGVLTYTSDQRFQVIKSDNSEIWTLQIKYLQFRDSGIYECQINTEPKISLSYNLHVIETKANISGPTDLYVKSGSNINLVCKISQGPHELGNIFWFKGADLLDGTTYYENELISNELTNRISIETDWSEGLHSRLYIQKALQNDTGNYTCVPSVAQSASVYVHIINGEQHPAAMQRNIATSKRHYQQILPIIFFFIQLAFHMTS